MVEGVNIMVVYSYIVYVDEYDEVMMIFYRVECEVVMILHDVTYELLNVLDEGYVKLISCLLFMKISPLLLGNVALRMDNLQCFEMAGRNDAAIAAALEAVARAVEQHPQVGAGNDGVRMLETFLRNHPPTFKGRYDPDGAQKWLKETERIFRVMQCSE
ncbi:hypothetical protein MTR_8g059660 [Medicago truncatula]|uniref:Cellular nucleic acid-binding protein n=1 Tax=Medicago truncatula TaxID=3880 RepID=G7LCU4_MEDTR|nr:hypothetical protein MTR_8g059660 [Medicago truncatula]